MANHIYATAEFSDVNQVDWKITIRKMTSGADQTTPFYVGADGFVITYENGDEYDVLTPIMGSTCEFTMMYEDYDRSRIEAMYTDILSGEDGLFCVEVHRDQDDTNELWWRGYILPEAIVVEDITPYERVTIRAVDGLGALDAVDFVGPTSPALINTFDHCLNELPYMELYSSSDTLFVLVDDFVPSNGFNYSTDYSSNLYVYQYARLDEPTWYNADNDGVNQYYSCKTVLESICKTFNLRLYQSKGVFHFMPLGALQDGANILGLNYSKGASLQGSSDVKHNAKFGLSQNFNKLRGWVQTAIPPHGEIKITRDYQGDKAVLSRANLDLSTTIVDESANYEAGQRFRVSANFLYRFTGIPTGNNDNNRYGRILLKVKLQIGNSLTESLNYYINRAYSIGTSSYIHASGDQYDNDFANTLELGADAYSEIEWTSTDASRYNLILPFIIDRENGTGQTLQDGYYINKQINFVTPEIPVTKTKLWLTVEAVGIQADGTTNSDYLATNFADYQLRNVKVQYTTGTQEQEFGTVDIKATADGRYNVDLGSTRVGDRIASEQYGIIRILGLSALYVDADDWRSRQSTTAGLSINKLAVNERMGFYRNGKVIQRGTLLQTTGQLYLTPHTIVRDSDNSYDYFISTLRHVAGSGQWDVTLVRDGRAISGITLAQDNSKPSKDVTANDPGNVSTPPNIKGDDMIANAFYNYNKRARQNFTSTWSAVIGTDEVKEMYWTLSNDGYGRYVDYQGESATAGTNIKRKVYVQTKGLQTAADSGWQTPAAVQPSLDNTLAQTINLIQEYINKVGDHGAYTFMVTWEEVAQNELLDDYSGATAAYSLRKLRQAYTGSAIVVRRSSDNTTASIGFDSGGNLNETALLSFVGTGGTDNGYVVSMYDQTGNGNIVTQSAISSQPQIVSAGVVIAVNGLPAIKFDGSNDSLPAATNFNPNPNNHLTVAAVIQHDVVNVGQQYFSAWNSTQSLQIVQLATQSSGIGRAAARYDNAALPRCDTSSSLSANTQYVVTAHFANNEAVAYFNGVEVFDGSGASISGADPNGHVNTFRLGGRSYDSALPFDGYMQEAVIWSNTSHQNEADEISVSINDYYNAY